MATVAPQSPSKIVASAEKALGGKKAIKAAAAWKAVGTITDPATAKSGKFQMQAGAPNLFHIAYDLDGFEYESGYNGRSGWVRDSRSGLRTLTATEPRLQSEAGYRSSLGSITNRALKLLPLRPSPSKKRSNVVLLILQKVRQSTLFRPNNEPSST